jgi:hypothetical protein
MEILDARETEARLPYQELADSCLLYTADAADD